MRARADVCVEGGACVRVCVCVWCVRACACVHACACLRARVGTRALNSIVFGVTVPIFHVFRANHSWLIHALSAHDQTVQNQHAYVWRIGFAGLDPGPYHHRLSLWLAGHQRGFHGVGQHFSHACTGNDDFLWGDMHSTSSPPPPPRSLILHCSNLSFFFPVYYPLYIFIVRFSHFLTAKLNGARGLSVLTILMLVPAGGLIFLSMMEGRGQLGIMGAGILVVSSKWLANSGNHLSSLHIIKRTGWPIKFYLIRNFPTRASLRLYRLTLIRQACVDCYFAHVKQYQ